MVLEYGILWVMNNIDTHTVQGVVEGISDPMRELMIHMNSMLRRDNADRKTIPDGHQEKHEHRSSGVQPGDGETTG